MPLKQSLRRSLRAPGFAISVILLVAGVVAVNATMFSALHALRWRALPYADGDRIVHVGADLQKLGFAIGLSERFRAQLAMQTDVVDGALGYLGSDGAPKDEAGREWRIARPMFDWLDVLGTQPALGRAFVADDASGDVARSVILSDRAWRQSFNADSAVLGRTLRVGDEILTIVGVMPPGFAFPDGRIDAWKPLVLSPAERVDAPNASVGDLEVALRMAPGATPAQVRERLDALFAADERVADVRANAGLRAKAVTWRERYSVEARTLSMLQLAGAILLIAVIANLVNLHLDRLLGRAREFRIRRALGAGDAAILRGVAADLAPPLCVGFALGMAVVPFGLRVLAQRELLPGNLLQPVQFGSVSLIAGALVTALVLVGVGLAVLGLRRVGGLSRAGVGGLGRGRAAMLVGQVMLTTVLLGSSGLLLRSAMNLMAVDPGFDAKGVLLTSVSFPETADDPGVPAATVEALRASVAAMPGVAQVAIADLAPFTGSDQAIKIQVPGIDGVQQARSRSVGVGYFAAMGIGLVRGRDFQASELTGTNPVIVDERYVERHLAGVDPLTASVDIPDGEGVFARSPIVAVVRTVKNASLDEVVELPTVYFAQEGAYGSVFLVTRTGIDPALLVEPLRRHILAEVPGADIGWHQPMRELVADTLAPRRAMIELVGAFARRGGAAARSRVRRAHGRRRERGAHPRVGAAPGRMADPGRRRARTGGRPAARAPARRQIVPSRAA